MAKFKVILSDPQTGTSKVVELEEARAAPFIGRKIGETMDGAAVDMPSTKVKIMGGSDKDGVPMRPDVHGGVRRKVVLSGGVGFNPTKGGERRRKAVRGKTKRRIRRTRLTFCLTKTIDWAVFYEPLIWATPALFVLQFALKHLVWFY